MQLRRLKQRMEEQDQKRKNQPEVLMQNIMYWVLIPACAILIAWCGYSFWQWAVMSSAASHQGQILKVGTDSSLAHNTDLSPQDLARNAEIVSICNLHSSINQVLDPLDSSRPILVHEFLGVDFNKAPFSLLFSSSSSSSSSSSAASGGQDYYWEEIQVDISNAVYASMRGRRAVGNAMQEIRGLCSAASSNYMFRGERSYGVRNHGRNIYGDDPWYSQHTQYENEKKGGGGGLGDRAERIDIACILRLVNPNHSQDQLSIGETTSLPAPPVEDRGRQQQAGMLSEDVLMQLQLLSRAMAILTTKGPQAVYVNDFLLPLQRARDHEIGQKTKGKGGSGSGAGAGGGGDVESLLRRRVMDSVCSVPQMG